jgi:uncharacterized integral membrane protein
MSETTPGPETPAVPEQPSGPGEGHAPPRSRSAVDDDPLRGSRTSGIWVAVAVLALLLVLLAVFVLQNTQEVTISFFGGEVQAPLAAALLIATAAGALIVVTAGTLRILQLRRRVRRERKR